MSDSEDVNLGGVTMWDLHDVKPDTNVTMRDLGSMKADVNVTMSDLEDVKPEVNMTTAVKPHSFMTTSALEDVEPVVKREISDSLEDEKPCIEALRAAVLLQAENIRQRGSVTPVTHGNTDVDKSTRSLETDFSKDEDQPSLISGTTSSKAEERSAYPWFSPSLDCTDIKEGTAENFELIGRPEGPEISERHGEETARAILKEEEQDLKSKYPRSEIPQEVPELCEHDRGTAVEQLETLQFDSPQVQFECLWCPNVYTLLSDRQRHMKQVHSDEYASLEKGWQHVTGSHQPIGPSTTFLERIVTSGFKKTHTGEKLYRCDVCCKDFTHSSALVLHKRTHTGEKPYACDICGKNYARSDALVNHKRTHTGEKPYKCDVCGKSFTYSNTLVNHKRTHTGEKPYKCDVCSKNFTQRGDLVTHKRTHTGQRPYKCDVCGRDFTQSSCLVTHRRTHTGQRPCKCDVCGKGFAQGSTLVAHKRTHTGERPYKCEVCGKTYARSNALVTHMRTHTGEKPYKCDVCGKGFTSSINLVTHKKTHRGQRIMHKVVPKSPTRELTQVKTLQV